MKDGSTPETSATTAAQVGQDKAAEKTTIDVDAKTKS